MKAVVRFSEMIDSIFDNFPPPEQEEMESEKPEGKSARSNDSMLTVLPTVEKIIVRKTARSWKSDASDLIQGVFLRLLKWRSKYREKSEGMSSEDWNSFAARTAFNEINRHFSDPRHKKNVSLETVSDLLSDKSYEGQSQAEVNSLTNSIWQEFCGLSLKQRQALLLNSQKLFVYLLSGGIDDEMIAEVLEISDESWIRIRKKIPLSDIQVAELTFQKGKHKSIESLARSIKKSRYEARQKLRRIIEK